MGVHGLNSRLYAGGVDLSRFLNAVSSTATLDSAEVTTLVDLAKKYISGVEDATLSGEGYFSGVEGEIDPVLFTALRNKNPVVMNYLPSGDIGGDYGYGLSCHYTDYEIDSPVAGAVGVSIEAQSNVGMERNLILHPLANRIVSGNGVAYDNGSATILGGSGYLQVAAGSGVNPTLTVKIQHSADNIDYVDLLSFNLINLASIPTAQRVKIEGNVNRWVRLVWTITGTTPSFTFYGGFSRF